MSMAFFGFPFFSSGFPAFLLLFLGKLLVKPGNFVHFLPFAA